jgi:TonB-dependent starch-binding outer membrane protein SusC
MSTCRERPFWAVLVAMVCLPSIVWAQHGAISGQVTDAATHAPIPDVQVRVASTGVGTLTHTDGTYRLVVITPGPVVLQALRLGFQAKSAPVTVPDSGTVAADFALNAAATTLDQVLVQATGQTERTRETGNSVQLISLDSVPKGAVANFSDVLSSRAPGVMVTQQSGTTGGTSRIRIRGNNSVSLTNGPLIVIDGVRADNDQSASQLDVGGQASSRIDDIDPSEIEDFQVLRGPSASALYGTAGANGVIQITTKHGTPGKPIWRAYEEAGTVRNYVGYPANYARIGLFDPTLPDTGGNRTTNCTILLSSSGGCTPFADSLVSFNPLETLSPNIDGWRNNYGLQVSGGTDAIGYFVSGDHRDEHGVYANNYANRTNARANLRATLSPVVDLAGNIGYLQSGVGLPQNDNASYGVLSGGLLGSAFDDPIGHGYLANLTPDSLAHVLSTQSLNRFTASATGTWRPLPWLSVVGVTGLDYEQTIERQIQPFGIIPIFPTGYVQTDPVSFRQYTTNLTGTAQYPISRTLNGTTSVGTQYSDQQRNQLIAFGQGLLPGVGTLAGATNQFSITEDNPEEVLFGGLIQQQLGWRDKVFFTAAVRTDKNSALANGSWTTYPDASLSWVIGEEPFFPRSSVLSSLRLRTAYGESGQRPQFREPLFFFSPAPAKKDGTELIGAIDTATGNPNLTAEISREFEAGFDAGLLKERINLQFTYYNKTTAGALVQRVLPPGSGGNVQFVNLGEVTNKGIEAQVSGTIFQSRAFTADVSIGASVNHNKLVKLGNGISPVTFDGGNAADTQEHTPGYSLGGFWSFPYTYSDANHDGIIEPDEITVGPNLVFFGNSQPSDEYTVAPALTFFKWLRVSALFDRHAGVVTYNGTEEFRCGGSVALCREAYDPTASLKAQAAAITEASFLSDAGAFEDGSFWKLRELTFRATLPERWTRRIRASNVALSISGRNLATWTKYTGFDPEINYSPNTNNGYNAFNTSDFLTQPPVRYWTARVDITW